jgi:hypothetical protein
MSTRRDTATAFILVLGAAGAGAFARACSARGPLVGFRPGAGLAGLA